MLKDIQASGHTTVDFHFRYDTRHLTGPDDAFRITFAAVLSIGLGELPIIASATVKYLEGDMTVKIKSAPSNRIWYGFTSEPRMELDIFAMRAKASAYKINAKMIQDWVKVYIKSFVSAQTVWIG